MFSMEDLSYLILCFNVIRLRQPHASWKISPLCGIRRAQITKKLVQTPVEYRF